MLLGYTQNDNYTLNFLQRGASKANTIIIMVMEEFMVYLRSNEI